MLDVPYLATMSTTKDKMGGSVVKVIWDLIASKIANLPFPSFSFSIILYDSLTDPLRAIA